MSISDLTCKFIVEKKVLGANACKAISSYIFSECIMVMPRLIK